jgi:integrase
MPTVKLTDAAVRRLAAPSGARIDYFDAAFPGLALRVTGASDGRPERRTWSYFYRFAGKQRRLTLGPGYPALGLAAARQAATEAQLQIRRGNDPAVTKAAARAEASRAPDTIASVVELFIKRHLEARDRAPRYIEETRRNFANHVLPRWGERPINAISRRDVIELLDAITDNGTIIRREGKRKHVPGGAICANRVLAAIKALFNFAIRRGILEASPVALVERPGAEKRRERTLRIEEIRTVWAAAEELGYPFGRFFQLALVTGKRRDEVARLQWGHLDLKERIWTLPAALTKAGRTDVVPLSHLAIAILRALPRKMTSHGQGMKPSPFVFTTAGNAPISGFSKAKQRLDEAIAKERANDGLELLPPWTVHDLRRTVATEMARLGISRFMIGRVLNHADRSVTAIYDRHEYLVEKRQALEAWAHHLEALTKGRQG